MSEAPVSPPASSEEGSSSMPSRSERFRNVMLGLAGGISALVIPLLGFYYTSSDKEREVAKDFVEISTKVLSDKPSDENRPLRKWAIDVLDKYSPVPLPADLKTFLVNNQPIYTAPGGISQNTLQNLESNGMILGIFLSHSNNTPDIAALKAHHIEFAYIRLSQGASFLDPKAEEYITQARNKSLKIGLYHFFVPDVDTDAQFANFQSVLRRVPWDLPPMIDCEELPAHPVPADYAARVARFAQKIEESFRIRPVIYTVAAFANGSLNESVAKYPLFIANFGAAADRGRPTLPKWWTNYLFWHVAASVADDPVLRAYDIIAFMGTEASLASLAPPPN